MGDSDCRNCPACGNGRKTAKGVKNGFEIVTCDGCGTIFTRQLPVGAEQQDYDQYYDESNLSVPDFVIERVREIVRGFDQHRRTNRLLDIGFGAGTILDVAAEQGWEVLGVEVSGPAAEQARSRGYEVFHGRLLDAEYPSDHFDVVTASEILEHLDEPRRELREVLRILRPGGLFWATTPSASGISNKVLGLSWSVLTPPEHTQLYSKSGLKMLLKGSGFEIQALRTHGTNPFELINRFRSNAGPVNTPFDRVQTSYSLNENLSSSSVRKMLKNTLNFSLDLVNLGDSLKIFARKPPRDGRA